MRESTSRYAILGALTLEPMSGYQIKEVIGRTIGHFWNEGYGQIYPTLRQLAASGLVTSNVEPGNGRPDRNVYTLTPAGWDELRHWLRQPPASMKHGRSELLLKLFFGRHVASAINLDHVRRHREMLSVMVSQFEAVELELDGTSDPDQPYWLITLRHGLHMARASLAWCDETIASLDQLGQRIMNVTAAPNVIERHPFRFAAVLITTVAALDQLLHTLLEALAPDASVTSTGIISGAVLSLLAAVTVSRLGLWRQLGLLGRPARTRTLLWFLPFVIYGLLPLTAVTAVSVRQLIAAAVFGLLTAGWKLLALGLLLHALLPRGAWTGSALTAALWAGMHLTGILVGALVVPTLVLVLSYVFLSFAFAAVRLRTGLLWPVLGSYALLLASASMLDTNGASNLASSVEDLLPALGVSVLLAAYGTAALLRRRAPATRSPEPQDTSPLGRPITVGRTEVQRLAAAPHGL